ncbi:nucleoside triphosphate pyrophosphohydrolase [Candidatus Riflebacteria bacterium]
MSEGNNITSTEKRVEIFLHLIEIMKQLRSPDHGCPWDLKQDHESLIPYLMEESSEVIQAIKNENDHDFKEELGDLFLQILFHCQLASEREAFDIGSCLKSIQDKLINRHPHVFQKKPGRKLNSASKVHKQWNEIKEDEKIEKLKELGGGHPLDDTLTLQNIVVSLGFEFPDRCQVRDKIFEELNEMENAQSDNLDEEAGDLLFSVINYLRFLKINPKKSLRLSMEKFKKRFLKVKDKLAAQGKFVNESSIEILDELWEEAKKEKEPPVACSK